MTVLRNPGNLRRLVAAGAAHFFLPTEDEWVKAAYWNGIQIQTYGNVEKGNFAPTADVDSRFDGEYSVGPWDIGSGTQELNGTYDMMGNLYEWLETPWESLYGSDFARGIRGGAYNLNNDSITSTNRSFRFSTNEMPDIGIRVVEIPEPCIVSLLTMGGIAIRRRRKRCNRN